MRFYRRKGEGSLELVFLIIKCKIFRTTGKFRRRKLLSMTCFRKVKLIGDSAGKV